MKNEKQQSTTNQEKRRSTQANRILDAWSGVSHTTIESMLTSDHSHITLPTPDTSLDIFDNSYTLPITNPTNPYFTVNNPSNTFTVHSGNLNNATYFSSTVDTGCVVHNSAGEIEYLSQTQIQRAYEDAEWARDLMEKAEKYPTVARLYEQLLLTLRLTHNAENEEDKDDK